MKQSLREHVVQGGHSLESTLDLSRKLSQNWGVGLLLRRYGNNIMALLGRRSHKKDDL